MHRCFASIKDEQNDHIGPRDSIVMFANGQYTKKTIQLNQHTEQSNVYMAAVHFGQPDTYELNASTEYRHFFWETPILHAYHPFQFQSQNKLIVQPSERAAKKICNATSLEGTWVDQARLAEYDPYMLHQMYENTEIQHSVVNKVFVPDTCQLNYVSIGKVAECLGRQTVHVWADQHIKRNLKALDQPEWCDLEAIAELDDPEARKAAFRCNCNEIGEDPIWWKDSAQPLILDNSLNVHARFYVNSLQGALVSERDRFIQQMEMTNHTDQADWVIVGIGNDDIEALQVTPKQFEAHLIRFFEQLRKIYPHQRVIVRTPQYFCCGTREGSSWNTGRSLAMTVAMRQVVQNQPNMVLWDVHQLGTDETSCFLTQGSTYSKRHVVNTENQFLWRLLCLA
ncbi:hypothetical protein EDC96DRAFT_73111 [Choanephora cucurbitarum]|nr:hypothetical protein EDC96DRAFT_73111 [Choanephora cucurbitarum]